MDTVTPKILIKLLFKRVFRTVLMMEFFAKAVNDLQLLTIFVKGSIIHVWPGDKYALHEKWSFPLRISSANETKTAGNCGFGHVYWKVFNGKLYFLCSDASVILLLVLRVTQSLRMIHSNCSQFFEINRQIYLYVYINKVKPQSLRFCHTYTTMCKWTLDTFRSFKK